MLYGDLLILCFIVYNGCANRKVHVTDCFCNRPNCFTYYGFVFSILIGFITVEIFRTPINNGSGLILITKAICRVNIVFSKSLISFLYILFINLVSMGFASFVFTNKDWDYEQSLKITLGMGVWTFFTGLIMTSIASLFLMFFSKTKYLIFTMGFTLSIMLVSFLGTYSVENEVKYLGERKDSTTLTIFEY